MGRQSRVNRQRNKRKTAWVRCHVRFAPLPLFPFRSLLELIKPSLASCWLVVSLQLHLFVSLTGIEIRPSYHYQHPGIEARRSPLWPSGLPSSGWERVTQDTDGLGHERSRSGCDAHVVLPQVFSLLSAFPIRIGTNAL